jgi:hypothetical protein
MTSRIIAIGLLAAFLGIGGTFIGIAILGPRNASADREPIVLIQEMGRWELYAELALSDSGSYELTLRFSEEDGGPASMPRNPTVRISMLGHDMGTTLLPVERVGLGSYRAVGSLSMQGRWRFRIESADHMAEITTNFRR